MKPYTLRLNKFQIYSTIAAPVFMLTGIAVCLLSWYYGKNIGALGAVFLFAALSFNNWNRYLRKPIEIDVSDGKAIFRDIFKKETEISFTDFLLIEVKKTKSLKIISKDNEIVGVSAFKDFGKLIADIKAKNSNIVVEGI